jgi:Carboxypeptidase regulatory-like domain
MTRALLTIGGLIVSAQLALAQPPPGPPVRIEMPVGAGQIGGLPQMPPRDNAQPPRAGKATVRGRVVAADTGQPLRKAQVRISSNEFRENRVMTTDAEGRYEFKELPAGRYTLSASKGSYVQLQYGQLRPFEPGKPIEVLEAQTLEKLDFALPKGGVITGRILDEFGEPLADTQVAAMRHQNFNGRRQLVPAGRPAMTNDIGEFRLFAIPPGQYYLSATLRPTSMMGDTDDRSGYAPTYFPGTSNLAEAQRVSIALGQVVSDVNMALMTTRTARISGIVVDSQGRPMMGMVFAMPRGESTMMMFGAPNQIKPDGSFSIGGLAPGTYVLQTQGGNGPESESAATEITLGGDDVTGIRLVAGKPSIAIGRVIVDAGAAGSLQPSTIRLMMQPVVSDMPMFNMTGPSALNDDLTFELKTRPGKMRVQLAGQPAGWSIRAVRYRGQDITDSGFEFRANENVSDLEVELTNRETTLSGLVTNDRGAAVKDYAVIVFPRDRDKWSAGMRYLKTSRPDQDGRFKVSGLPPGDYYAIALDYVDSGEWTEPEFLERVRSNANEVSLNEGETKSLDLRLKTAS